MSKERILDTKTLNRLTETVVRLGVKAQNIVETKRPKQPEKPDPNVLRLK